MPVTNQIRRFVVDNEIEKKIIAVTIFNKHFLSELKSIYGDYLKRRFKLTQVNKLLDMVYAYYDQYSDAPGTDIKSFIEASKEKNKDELKDFVDDLYNEGLAEINNVPHMLDRTSDYLKRLEYEVAATRLAGTAHSGDLAEAKDIISNLSKAKVFDSRADDSTAELSSEFFNDYYSKDHSEDELFEVEELKPITGTLCRGWLLSFLAPMTRGKSWLLQDLALNAIQKNLGVAFISLENSREQMLHRFSQRISGYGTELYEGSYTVLDCLYNQIDCCPQKHKRTNLKGLVSGNKADILDKLKSTFKQKGNKEAEHINLVLRLKTMYETSGQNYYRPCTACANEDLHYLNGFFPSWWEDKLLIRELTNEIAKKKMRDFEKANLNYKNKLQVYYYPPGSADTERVFGEVVEKYEKQNRSSPDVIITDYADRFIIPGNEHRHGIDNIWQKHKQLAGELKCLVATASQTNRAGIDKFIITEKDFAEDIRKLAICDVVVGGNQTYEEHRHRIYRFNTIKHRHMSFNVHKQIMGISLLEIGQPLLHSCPYPFY